MKKILLISLLGIFLLSSCAKQNPQDFIGQGDPVQSEDVKEFKITAKRCSFEPSVIEVNKGDKVRLTVESLDVPHGFSILEYGINERLDPGKEMKIEFTADKQGTFTFFCSVFCGSGHTGMKGKIIVR